MKLNSIPSPLSLFWSLFATMTISGFMACNNPCKDVTCNNGECVDDGECVCDSGYEGDNCETSNNSKFNGTYLMQELCDSTTALPSYPIEVTPVQGTPNEFNMSGLHGESKSLRAKIEDDGVGFSIARQDFIAGQEIATLSGSISIDARTINLSYRIYQGSDTLILDRCSGSMTK